MAGFGPALAVFHEFVQQPAAMVLHQIHLLFGEFQGVGAEVVAAGQGIGAGGVFIRGEGQLGFGDARQHGFHVLGLVAGHVAVFDRPEVVRPNVDHAVIALFVAADVIDVDGDVIHDGAGEGFLALELGAVDFLHRINAGGLEVVPQAERVAHFMHHQVGDQRPDEPLGNAVELFFLGFFLFLLFVFAGFFLGGFGGDEIGRHVQVEAHQGHVDGFAFGGAAVAVDLADAAHQAVKLMLAHQFGVGFGHGVAAVGFGALHRDGGGDGGAFRRRREPHARIPAGMQLEPREGLRRESFHRHFRQHLGVLLPIVADPAVGEDDVRVENFPGQRVHAAGPDGGADVVVEPADEVIAHILGVFVHVLARVGVLVVHLDGVGEADFFIGLVPHEQAFAHPAAVTDGSGVFNVENDRFLDRADLEAGIGFFQMPAVDVAHGGFIARVLAEIGKAGGEVANAGVGFARFEAGVGVDPADGVMQGLDLPSGHGHFEGHFDVAREYLGSFDVGQVELGLAHRAGAEELGRIVHQQRPQVDDRPPVGHHGQDGHVGDHPVREQPAHGGFGFVVPVGADRQVRLDEHQPVADPFPVAVIIARLQPGVAFPTGHSHGDEELLLFEIFGQRR